MKNKQSTFICHSWLGIGIGDGRIDRIFTASKDEIVKDIETLFLANASKGIADDHIWFSILMRPPRNQFTRCQRVSCCLSTLLCTMLANAMFYRKDKVVGATIDIGSFKFSWTQIMIGIQSAFIVFPINLLIVALFRKCKAHPSKKESKNSTAKKLGDLLKKGNVNKKENKTGLEKDHVQDHANYLDFIGQMKRKEMNDQNANEMERIKSNLKIDLSTCTMDAAEILNKRDSAADLNACINVKDDHQGHGESPHPVDPSIRSQQVALPTIRISTPNQFSGQTLNSRLSISQQSLVHNVGGNSDHGTMSKKDDENASSENKSYVQDENVLNRYTASVSSMQKIGTELIRDQSIFLNVNDGRNVNGEETIASFVRLSNPKSTTFLQSEKFHNFEPHFAIARLTRSYLHFRCSTFKPSFRLWP